MDKAKKTKEKKNIKQPVAVASESQLEAMETKEAPEADKGTPLEVEEVEVKDELPAKKSGKKLFILGAILLLLIIVLGVVGFIFFPIENLPWNKNTAPPVSKETTTTLPVLVKSDWSFEVLNGSGVTGAAGKTADELEALGYRVVEIGNADKQTYIGNGLFVSQKMKDKVNLLVSDLKDTITIATVAGILKDSTASARIIIGR